MNGEKKNTHFLFERSQERSSIYSGSNSSSSQAVMPEYVARTHIHTRARAREREREFIHTYSDYIAIISRSSHAFFFSVSFFSSLILKNNNNKIENILNRSCCFAQLNLLTPLPQWQNGLSTAAV